MILLDTNAILYLATGHRRAKPLAAFAGRLRASPISLFELQMLSELGRLRWKRPDFARAFEDDPRWTIDDPAIAALVTHALTLGWTRDPFDRLLVAHARLRGFRLATSDALLLERLEPRAVLEL